MAVGREGDKRAGTHRVECGAAMAADEFLDLLVRNLEDHGKKKRSGLM